MTNMDLPWTEATALVPALASGEVSATEVATAYADRIDALNPQLNAFVHFDRKQVLRDAAELDRKRSSGEPLGRLHGVPYAVKLLTSAEGMPSNGGIKPWLGSTADRDPIVVSRLRAAGGLILGLTNAPELGYYGGTNNHIYGPTHNPWKLGHTPGGSSGGAAVAVAAGLAPLAEGTDGAGSVRIPASLCGVVGFKPSLGRIPQQISPSRFQSNLYHGPITRTVADSALMLDVMAGPDAGDVYSLPKESLSYSSNLDRGIKGLRVAYSPDLGTGQYVDPEVSAIVRSAVSAFEELGANVAEASPSWPAPTAQIMWEGVWVPGYAALKGLADWESLDGVVDEGYIEIMKAGASLTAARFGENDMLRGIMYDTYTSFMQDYDLIVSPTLSSASFPFSQFEPSWLEGQSLPDRILGWLLTYPFNMLTTPAISVPAGFTSDGRPVGLQIAGRWQADGDVLNAAAAFEEARPWKMAKPPIG